MEHHVYHLLVFANRPRRVARNLQWGANFWVRGRSPRPSEANGGLEAEPSAAGDTVGLGLPPEDGDFYCFMKK